MSTPIPRPGEHRPGLSTAVDPGRIHTDVDALLAKCRDIESDPDPAAAMTRRADLLDHAHDVLVHALSTVDKI